ncbi:MAG: hypothetical protein IPH77_20685 [Ignavibacteria bacterium]|nr:hypothetical protein [Ignavibacteria bacterium]
MKTKLHHTGKLILLLLMFATPVFSQSIINTVGTDGIFAIKDATNNFLTVSQTTGLVNILRTFGLRIHSTQLQELCLKVLTGFCITMEQTICLWNQLREFYS